MKKIKLYILVIVLAFSAFSLISCFDLNESPDNPGEDNGSNNEDDYILNKASFTVKFDSDGGTEIKSQTVKEDEKILKPDDPEKEGYRFIGWKLGFDYWSFGKNKVKSDITLKAYYEPINYKVSFSEYGGSEIDDTLFNISDLPLTLTLPKIKKDDAVFCGWSYEEGGEAIKTSDIIIDKIGNVCFHALYKEAAEGIIYEEYSVTCAVVGYEGSEKDVIIPEYHAGKMVYEIANRAFENSDIVSVALPDTVEKLTALAFIGAKSLEEIKASDNSIFTFDGNSLVNTEDKMLVLVLDTPDFPKDGSVELIGNYAFNLLEGELNLVIPEGVTTLSTYAFGDCINLKTLSLPESIIEVGVYAFEGCDSLVYTKSGEAQYLGNPDNPHMLLVSSNGELSINSKTRIIYRSAFRNSESMTKLYIPSSVRIIDSAAFSNCINLSELTIANGLEKIGSDAFRGCTALPNLTLPDSVTYIGNSAFAGCNSIYRADLGAGIKTINGNAFSDCENLHYVYMGENVEEIGYNAFSTCTWLQKITIPISVKYIGSNAFINCRKLTVYARAESKPSGWNSEWKPTYVPVVWGYDE